MQNIPKHIFTDTLNFFQITDGEIIQMIFNITHPENTAIIIPYNANYSDLIKLLSHYSQSPNNLTIAENFFFQYFQKHPFIQKLIDDLDLLP